MGELLKLLEDYGISQKQFVYLLSKWESKTEVEQYDFISQFDEKIYNDLRVKIFGN